MKKKSLMFLITVTLVIAAFAIAVPASAGERNHDHGRALFEADIVPVGVHPLVKGEVYIRDNGDFKVEIEGAEPGQTYLVYLMYGDDPGNPSEKELVGQPTTFTTDEDGECKLEGVIDNLCGNVLNPWIELRDGVDVHYVSGFILYSCEPDGPNGGIGVDLPGAMY